MANQQIVFREGVTAGLLGAAGVALWFLGVDILHGQALATPAMLGAGMLKVLGRGVQHSMMFNVAAFTVFHVAVFINLGLLMSDLVDISRRVPQVLVGLLLFFVIFEAGFYGMAALMSDPNILGKLGWYQIGASNLVAAALMGGYMWRKHPEIAGALAQGLDGSV